MVNHFRRCRSWDFWDLVRETSYWEEIFVSHFFKTGKFHGDFAKNLLEPRKNSPKQTSISN